MPELARLLKIGVPAVIVLGVLITMKTLEPEVILLKFEVYIPWLPPKLKVGRELTFPALLTT